MRKIKDILISNNFHFNHNLGQNFITDINFLNKIVELAGVGRDDTVVEIGTGAGTLTRALAEVAKKVYSFEVDTALAPILEETLSGYSNIELYFKDVLKLSDEALLSIIGGEFKLVANLPYYVTTALIMRFLEGTVKPKSITIMVQQEVAERLVAKNDTAEYGAITMSLALYGDAKIVDRVSRNIFYPVPNVDSALVRIDLHDKYKNENITLIQRLIKSAFLMRRKTLVNNLSSVFSISKDAAQKVLSELNFDTRIRGEALSLEDIILISKSKTFLEAIKL